MASASLRRWTGKAGATIPKSWIANVIAYSQEIDEESMRKLHVKCLEEVKQINGAIRFEDAYIFQNPYGGKRESDI